MQQQVYELRYIWQWISFFILSISVCSSNPADFMNSKLDFKTLWKSLLICCKFYWNIKKTWLYQFKFSVLFCRYKHSIKICWLTKRWCRLNDKPHIPCCKEHCGRTATNQRFWSEISLVIASTFFLVAQLYIFLVVASSMFLWYSLMQSHPVPCVWPCHEWVFLLLWYVMWNIYVLFSFSFLSIFCSRPCKTFLSN